MLNSECMKHNQLLLRSINQRNQLKTVSLRGAKRRGNLTVECVDDFNFRWIVIGSIGDFTIYFSTLQDWRLFQEIAMGLTALAMTPLFYCVPIP